MNIEKGKITITGEDTKTMRTLILTDSTGVKIDDRRTDRNYVAAANFAYTLSNGMKCNRTFYFGRKDLIGKGESKFWFDLLASGGPSSNGYITEITRGILFEL